MEEQLTALIQSVNEGRVANDAKLEAIQHSLELWRPAVTNLQQQFDDLRTQVGHIALHPALADEAAAAVELVVRAHLASSSSDHGYHGPRGHDAIDISGGLVHGVVTWGGHHPGRLWSREEILEAMPHRDYRRPEPLPARVQPRLLLAPAAPVLRGVPLVPHTAAEDRRGLGATRVADRRSEPGRGEDRVAALRNYRRARGLCFKCGERWGQGHQCAATVQLHVVEELLELMQAEKDERQGPAPEVKEDQLMSISKLATTGQKTSRTVRLPGQIDNQKVLILVDSSNSHSFISEAVADKFGKRIQAMAAMSVKMADGGLLSCSGYIPQCTWSMQGYTFVTDLHVLSLGCYDMVIGMDWLERCGPMMVDWVQKTLAFQNNGENIILQGLGPDVHQLAEISLERLEEMEQANSVVHVVMLCTSEHLDDPHTIPSSLQRVLDQFQIVFDEPSGLL